MEDLGKCRSIPWKHPWHRDDFDPCFRELFIESLVPAIVIVASVAIAALATLRTLRQRTLRPSTNRFSYLPLIQGKAQLHNNRQGGVSTSTSSGYGSINSEEQPTEWDGWHSDSSSSDDNSDDGRDKAIDDTPPPQGQQPISIRDTILVSLSALQLLWVVLLFGDNGKGETSMFEVLLWLWAVVLCVYIFYRPDLRWPSPSPHLRFVYTAGFAVDAIKMRTALLAYSREEINAFPKIPIAMAAAAGVLFFASFTQQRRSHGLPSSTPVGASSGNPPAPEMTASIAQLLFFSWMDPMICLGYKRSLEPNDVYDIMPEDRSAYVCARWNRENQTYIQTHGRDTRSGGTISTVCQSQALWIGRKIGMHIKAIVIGEVYTKSLRRRDAASSESSSTTSTTPSSSSSSVAATDEDDGSSSRKGNQDAVNNGDTGNEGGSENTSTTSVGKITNLMAVDAHKISEVSAYLHFLYQLPAEMVITMVMLYQLLGVASLAGLCAIIMLVPLQWYLVSVWSVFQNQLMKASDRRMGMMNEILQGVRIIKFFGWEPQFEKQVASVRGCELSVLRKRYLVLTCSIMLFFMAPVFVTLATFGVHTKVMGRPLTASVAFTALALFKTLRGPMDQLPDFFSFCLQAKASVDRVAKFLAEEDTPKYELTRLTRKAHSGVVGRRRRPSYAEVVGATDIGFIDASFSWQKARGSSGRIGDSNPLLAGASTGVADTVVVSDVDSSEEDAVTFQLQQLTASFPVGKLSIIAGPTGSGKTSMLMALLGEMRLTKGQLMVPGAMFNAGVVLGGNPLDPFSVHESVAYVAQQAWLLNDTIRGNITFGMPYDEQRYREVVRMCALARDFEILEAGDMTEVGERGVALSGGQKQRICLARAVYSPARHVIMDDCLSAVDAHTAKHLYESCLMSPHMAERTRILVTHAVGLAIKGASMVVVMQDGRIAASGTPVEVLQSGRLSEETLREADEEQQSAVSRAEEISAAKGKAAATVEDMVNGRFDGSSKKTGSGIAGSAKGAKAAASKTDNNNGSGSGSNSNSNSDSRGKLTTEEGWSHGHVQWSVYSAYFKASGGTVFWAALIMMFLVKQGLMVAQDWWLREWAASYSSDSRTGGSSTLYNAAASSLHPLASSGIAGNGLSLMHATLLSQSYSMQSLAQQQQQQQQQWHEGNNTQYYYGFDGGHSNGDVDLGYFIGIYALIAIASIVLIFGQSLVQFWASLRASKRLHEQLLHTILRAPVRFFDTTPVGRLINRFSKDMETIDQALSSSLAIFLTELISAAAILVVIAVITPTFTLGAVLVAGIYWVIGTLYLATSRELKRFESVTKSPIYTQFGETLNGVSTIRAYGQETRFQKANYRRVDDNIRSFIYMWGANRWLSIRVDLVGACVSFMAGLLALAATGRMDAGLAGLSLAYALNFTEHVLWVVRFYSVNEMNLNSVERVVEYLDVDPEAPVSIPDRMPPADWPTDGRISVEDLVLRYAENLPPVIRGVSFTVSPREKVGIVGRTGAGKSTLTLAMFRFMEASAGRIVIDGIDISKIGVGDLRSRLTIIPQDPVLFTGTIRSNLDPFGEHGDDELWLALRRAHLLGDEEADRHATISVRSRSGVGLAGSSRASITSGAGAVADACGGNTSLAGSRAAGLGRTISGLEMAVMEGGSNFSQGQRQLIALARALVKRTRVIILDEATASVDFDTDAKIQTTIRTEFVESTLLCIAHRLRTVVDYDKVLVLDHGEVVEYDTPFNLLQKRDGLFRHMCLKSGEYDHLFAAADRKHQRSS
ncbi:hypothetical protein GGI11_001476 [Coemansia sp. RSA 2049]|nr:hypothetical protein GGI11_001476 [Coemansia sp. RSA 2049]